MPQDIFIIDDQHPEDLAMLQALYSRSPASVISHLEKLKQTGSGKFMDNYYVGYGHASIGDCGSTTVFIEQVSMLVAKAIQDNPLYNGQEASTRYLDFSKQTIIDPYDNPISAKIQARWMEIYNRVLPLLTEGLKQRYAFNPTEYKSERTWLNALNARAFDIARALLPIGTTTLLSWSTTLRSARDHLRRLKHHPLPEVRETALTIFAHLRKKYANSFREDDMDLTQSARDTYAAKFAERTHFVGTHDLAHQFDLSSEETAQISKGDMIVRRAAIDLVGLNAKEQETLSSRPSGAALPWRLECYGRYNFKFLLDFGSFRDLQRHRNGVCQIPVIDAQFGMHPWYMQQCAQFLSPPDWDTLHQDIASQMAAIAALPQQGIDVAPFLSQYLYPMGIQALVHVSYSVPQTVYVGELRSAKTVHPSLRPVAQKMLEVLKHDMPSIALYGDRDQDSWSAKRGEQTIANKVA
jgi:thymidylate synthase ThyX